MGERNEIKGIIKIMSIPSHIFFIHDCAGGGERWPCGCVCMRVEEDRLEKELTFFWKREEVGKYGCLCVFLCVCVFEGRRVVNLCVFFGLFFFGSHCLVCVCACPSPLTSRTHTHASRDVGVASLCSFPSPPFFFLLPAVRHRRTGTHTPHRK
jgi:hypothetical protein